MLIDNVDNIDLAQTQHKLRDLMYCPRNCQIIQILLQVVQGVFYTFCHPRTEMEKIR